MPRLFGLIFPFVRDVLGRHHLDVVGIDVGPVGTQDVARRGGGLAGARAVAVAVEVGVAEIRSRGVARVAFLEVAAGLGVDAEAIDLAREAGRADDVARAVGAVARAERARAVAAHHVAVASVGEVVGVKGASCHGDLLNRSPGRWRMRTGSGSAGVSRGGDVLRSPGRTGHAGPRTDGGAYARNRTCDADHTAPRRMALPSNRLLNQAIPWAPSRFASSSDWCPASSPRPGR